MIPIPTYLIDKINLPGDMFVMEYPNPRSEENDGYSLYGDEEVLSEDVYGGDTIALQSFSRPMFVDVEQNPPNIPKQNRFQWAPENIFRGNVNPTFDDMTIEFHSKRKRQDSSNRRQGRNAKSAKKNLLTNFIRFG